MARRHLIFGVALASAVVLAWPTTRLSAQRPPASAPTGSGLEAFQLRPNFYVISGAGGNISVQIGDDGVVVIDAGTEAKADAVVATIKAITPKAIRYVIDTNADADHVGGNEKVSKAGKTLYVVNNALATAMTNGGAATILAAEQVLLTMSSPTGKAATYPAAAWPSDTFARRRAYMFLNDEAIEIMHQPAAHSDGDSIVFFRKSDVVVASDIIDVNQFPAIDVAKGGSIQGEIDALNRLVELAVPSVPLVSREAGTLVVPGHGRILDQLDVVEYRDMVTIIRDRIQEMAGRGMTLEQIKAAAPTKGYTKRYGADSGPWTTDMFVEAIFKTLKQKIAVQ